MLITGATGFFGWQVFLGLFSQSLEARSCLPIRAKRGQESDKRVAALVTHSFPPEEGNKALQCAKGVAAVLTQENLGIPADEAKEKGTVQEKTGPWKKRGKNWMVLFFFNSKGKTEKAGKIRKIEPSPLPTAKRKAC